MIKLKESVRQAISEKNWYSALAGALALPDICGWLENPNLLVGERYRRWYESYIQENYTGTGEYFNEAREYIPDETQKFVFLSGQDCYALRCAYLHNGLDEISHQKARDSLNQFRFVTPPGIDQKSQHLQRTINFNDDRQLLQLQVDIFCEDLCKGVDQWETTVAKQKDIQERIGQLLIISEA